MALQRLSKYMEKLGKNRPYPCRTHACTQHSHSSPSIIELMEIVEAPQNEINLYIGGKKKKGKKGMN